MRRLVAALALIAPTAALSDTYTDYALQCAADIGEIPAFSCADGVQVPVTVNGQTPYEYTKDMTCDRPRRCCPTAPTATGNACPTPAF